MKYLILVLVLYCSTLTAQRPSREAHQLSKGPLVETFNVIKTWTPDFANAPRFLDTLDFVEFSHFYSSGSGSGLQRGDSAILLNTTGSLSGKRCGFKIMANSQDRLCTELRIDWHKVTTGARDSNPRACTWQVLYRIDSEAWLVLDFERTFYNHSNPEGGQERLVLPSSFSNRSLLEIAMVSRTSDKRYLNREPAGSRPRLAIDHLELHSIRLNDSIPEDLDTIPLPETPPCDTLIIHDTILRPVPVWVFDTIYVFQRDTLMFHDTLMIYDSIWVDLSDSNQIPPCDTLVLYLHDTLFIHDTIVIRDSLVVHDTLVQYVPAWIYDTIVLRRFDTLYIHDTLWIHDTVFLVDTICPNAIEAPLKSSLSLEINPNPSSDRVRLSCGQELMAVHWYDMQGKRVYPDLVQRGVEWCFDVSALAPGLYIVRCQTRAHGAVLGKVAVARL